MNSLGPFAVQLVVPESVCVYKSAARGLTQAECEFFKTRGKCEQLGPHYLRSQRVDPVMFGVCRLKDRGSRCLIIHCPARSEVMFLLLAA